MDHWVTLIAHKQVDESPYAPPQTSIDYQENQSDATSSSHSSDEDGGGGGREDGDSLSMDSESRKTKKKKERKNFTKRLYFFDSRNQDYLFTNQYEIMKKVLTMVKEGHFHGLSIVNRHEIQKLLHSIFDVRRLLQMLTDVVIAGSHLHKYFVESQLHA